MNAAKIRFCHGSWVILSALMLVLSASVARSQSIDQAEFLGFRPGAHADSCPAAIQQGRYQKLGRYLPNPHDSLSFEGIPLKSVVLYFHQGYLHSIDVKTTGANTDALLLVLEAYYGPGTVIDNMGLQKKWKGSKVSLTYEKSMLAQDGTFSFLSLPIHDHYVKWMDWVTAPKE